MSTKKLKLENLSVRSFITKLHSTKKQTVKGGDDTERYTIDGSHCQSNNDIRGCSVTSTTNVVGYGNGGV